MIFSIMTIMIIYLMVNLISAAAMAIIWRQNRRHFSGMFFWFLNMVLQSAGSLLIIARGVVPAVVSIVLSNIFVGCGMVLLLIGLEQFVGRKGFMLHNWLLQIIFGAAMAYFTFIQPNLAAREIAISANIVIIDFQICWLLFRGAPAALHKFTRIAGIALSGYVLVSFIRMVLLMVFPPAAGGFFESGLVDSISLLLYVGLSSCLTICLIIMVNARLMQQIQVQEKKFSSAFHSSPYAILLTRLSDGSIFEVNKGFENMTGYPEKEAIGKTTLELGIWVREEDRMKVMQRLLKMQTVQNEEIDFKKRSGELFCGLYSANIILIENENCVMSSISDITEISQMKERLHAMATHDGLTGLPNRILFDDRFGISVANAQRKKQNFAILSVDVDMFKSVNDNHGHPIGDLALRAVADRLTGTLRKADTIARFGGDEFVVLLGEMEQREDAVRVAEKILDEFRKPFFIQEITLILHLSLGIALYPDDGMELNELIRKSDAALYYVKEHGRDNYQFCGSLTSV